MGSWDPEEDPSRCEGWKYPPDQRVAWNVVTWGGAMATGDPEMIESY